MVSIKSFGKIQIWIYIGDHNPPHIHVNGPDSRAVIEIKSAKVIKGRMPSGKVAKDIMTWVKNNKSTLMKIWNENQK